MRALRAPVAVGAIGALASRPARAARAALEHSSGNSGGSPATKSQGGGTVTVLIGHRAGLPGPVVGLHDAVGRGRLALDLGLYTYAHKSGEPAAR